MWRFAWRNLLTRPIRTLLAMVGLSVPILGVVGLFSLSYGLRNLVGDTLSQIQGVMVLRENVPSPVLSDLPTSIVETLRSVPGVVRVAPEVWRISPPIEGRSLFFKSLADMNNNRPMVASFFDAIVIQGQDIEAHRNLKSAVYPRHLLPSEQGGGRFLQAEDKGTANIVISTKIAREYPISDPRTKQERPRQVGDSLRIGTKTFKIIGIYETGSMFLDVVVVMDIGTARDLFEVADLISSVYVEGDDPSANDAMSTAIETRLPGVDARSMQEFQANFGLLMGQLDKFLLMTVSLALVVGVVGIVNTMLMSTTERFVEFGVLRTNGWSRRNVLTLVTAESASLGVLSGVLGCLLALGGTALANQFLDGGLKLLVTPDLLALGVALSMGMGTLGGLYPAWKASRLVPMDAIRRGSR